MNSSAFEASLDALSYVGSTTKIDGGLEVAFEEMFQESNGMRPDKIQNLFLITDGQQTGVDFSVWQKKFNDAGIRVIVIGVGNFRERDIIHLVNTNDDLYIAADFDELLSDGFVERITTCGGKIILSYDIQ